MGSPHGRCNGVRRCGAMGTSRRVRGPAAHRAADRAAACKTLSVCYLPSRTHGAHGDGHGRGGASRHGRWRGGAPYRQAARAVRTATGRLGRNCDNARSPSRTRCTHGAGARGCVARACAGVAARVRGEVARGCVGGNAQRGLDVRRGSPLSGKPRRSKGARQRWRPRAKGRRILRSGQT